LLSVLIATKNSEDTIERCLESVKDIADEIIVVDSGSTDKTIEIVKKYTDKIFFKEWVNSGIQYNYLFSLAKGNWTLIIDSDEELSKELKESIKKILESKDTKDCYAVSRKTYYFGKFLNYVWYPEWRIRLAKKGKLKFEERVHAKAICSGEVGKLKGDLYHYSFKNLKHHIEKNIKFASFMADYMHRNSKKFKVYKMIFNPIWYFIKYFFIRKGFLDGIRGFIACSMGSFYVFMKYAFLFELELKEKYGKDLWKR
jgi:glycosyltransferase involved in cell wall biosynthesis